MQGKPAGCLAHPDHHRGQTGYVSLILYLTDTKSIVIPSLVSCVSVIKRREGKGALADWEALWMDLKFLCASDFNFEACEVCFIRLITIIKKR